MENINKKITAVLSDLKKGKMIIMIDNKNRENEGDIAMAGEKVTAKHINFMIKECRGLICVPMAKKRLKELSLPQMVKDNQDEKKTKFTISIDWIGSHTGISAFERAKTIKKLSDPEAMAQDFKRPGHVFPLEYHQEGLLKRSGHTEAMIELLKLGGLKQVGVICEIIRDDGRMARTKDLLAFSKKFDCKIIEIKDIIKYLKNT